jgi:hypothetical protein
MLVKSPEQSKCAVVQVEDKYIVADASSVAPATSIINRLITYSEDGIEHVVKDQPLPPGEYFELPHFIVTADYKTSFDDLRILVEHRTHQDLADLRGTIGEELLDYKIGVVKNY